MRKPYTKPSGSETRKKPAGRGRENAAVGETRVKPAGDDARKKPVGGRTYSNATGDDARKKPAGGKAHSNAIGEDYLEGKHAIEEALYAGVPVRELLVADGTSADKTVQQVMTLAQERGAKVSVVARQQLDARSAHGAHQGMMAAVRPYRYAELSDIIKAASGKRDALVIVLDHVTDTGNLGAIARTAEVVGAQGLLIPNKRAAQVTPVAYKSSAGALMHLPVAREANLTACLKRLKDEGFWVVGASEKAETDIWHAPLEGRIALVMGSEGDGISRLVGETCDLLVSLPQAGKVGSLNVAQATTAIAYEWMRRCMATPEEGA